jgi:hypothetical protein
MLSLLEYQCPLVIVILIVHVNNCGYLMLFDITYTSASQARPHRDFLGRKVGV